MTAAMVRNLLRRKRLGFRTVCTTRVHSAAASPFPRCSAAEPVSKFIKPFKEEFQIGQSLVTFETGKIARFCNDTVVMGLEENKVRSTVVSAKGDAVKDFLPLTVMSSVFSSDGRYDPDVMAANATSAALMLSDFPWRGPIGMIQVGRIDGQLVVNPTMDEEEKKHFTVGGEIQVKCRVLEGM